MTDSVPVAPPLAPSLTAGAPAPSSSVSITSKSSLSLADQLAVKRNQLSSVAAVPSTEKKLTAVSDDELKAYYNDVLDINLEAWIHIIEAHTFATSMIPVSIDDAKALIVVYKEMKRANNAQEMTPAQRARYYAYQHLFILAT